jgi:hypothetical protein
MLSRAVDASADADPSQLVMEDCAADEQRGNGDHQDKCHEEQPCLFFAIPDGGGSSDAKREPGCHAEADHADPRHERGDHHV